jgi:hypothetical protein
MQAARVQGSYEGLFDRYLPGQFTRLSKRLDGQDPI